MTGAVRRIEDFVVENAEVQGEAKTNGVCWGELRLCNIGGILHGRLVELRTCRKTSECTLYASWAAVAATLRFSPEANSAR